MQQNLLTEILFSLRKFNLWYGNRLYVLKANNSLKQRSYSFRLKGSDFFSVRNELDFGVAVDVLSELVHVINDRLKFKK